KDNYLEMLAGRLDNYDRALEYVKNSALGALGDHCKLLNNIYFDPEYPVDEPPIQYNDKNCSKLSFINERHERVIDPKGRLLMKRLASNLQRSYITCLNDCREKNKQCSSSKKVIEDYDEETMNKNIQALSQEKLQKGLINN